MPLNCLSPSSLTRRGQRFKSASSQFGHPDDPEGRATMGNTTSFTNVTQIVETGGGLLLDASVPKCTLIVVPATSTSIFKSRQQNARSITPHEARSFPPLATALTINSVIMSSQRKR